MTESLVCPNDSDRGAGRSPTEPTPDHPVGANHCPEGGRPGENLNTSRITVPYCMEAFRGPSQPMETL